MAENKCAARLEPSSRDMSELKNRFKPGYDWETICSTMLEHLMCGVAIYELCPDRVRSLYFNKKYYEMVGYTKEQYEQYADSVTSSLYGDSAEMIFEKAGRSAKTGETFYAECKGRRYDGSDIWVLVKAKLVDFIESEHPVFLAIVQDMTNRKLAEYENAVNLERYRILEATSNAVTFEYDIPDDIMTFSYSGGRADSANRSISNYAEVSKRTKIVYPDDAAKFYAALKKASKKPVSCMTLDYRSTIIDQNSYRWVRTCYSSVADASGKVIKVLGRTQDIDNEKREQQRMIQLVELDSTTGLLNKLATTNHIQRLISEKTNAKSFFAMLDIDDFKAFNDTYGHTVGDRILQVFTERVRKRMDFPHLFARIGGDEFILIAYGQENEEKADKLFNGIRVALQDLVVEGAGDVRISFSMGKAVYPRDGNNIDELIAHADGDIYTEKRTRSGKIGATA